MNNRRWFHPNITGREAEHLLLTKGVDGSFLCRPSESIAGDFSLSVRRGDKVTHIKIHNSGECYDLYGGEKFASLTELIQHYLEKSETLREKTGEIIELKSPLHCIDPTTERWFHESLTGKDAESLLLEKNASVGSFLVRESQTSGDFVLSVRVEDREKEAKFDIGGGEMFNSLCELVEYYRLSPMVETGGKVIFLKTPYNTTRISRSLLSERIKELNQAGNQEDKNGKKGFLEEFEQLGQQEFKEISREDGKKSCNKSKNRYKNILPYNRTSVILTDGTGEDGDDYINANYIRASACLATAGDIWLPNDSSNDPDRLSTTYAEEEPAYIATQGCLTNTITDFWRMVWNENSRVIIMTTKDSERGKKKCAIYWPKNVNEKMEREAKSGNIIIELIQVEENDFYITRLMRITKCGFTEARFIHQFQFKAWPDHGTPQDPGRVLDLLTKVDEAKARYPRTGPIIVHCSAGIGRTGTFIAIHILIKQIEDGAEAIDIQKTILALRAQRSGMVQTEAQYKFVYKALEHHIDVISVKDQAHKAAKEAGREYHNVQYKANEAGLSRLDDRRFKSTLTPPPSVPRRIPPIPPQTVD
ncbi:DgyrCDS7854 [Dimorphilus gyrociliatus]|uniref:protein-tyrosine-phosphatase n=1 Tax=Dimorphilus gyrociliatus TaxID=2664684 RepID=A0A7I8VSC8_9ANNE|nr:DgyrCDS7854 [Dimorphilus gyrociliatus]